MPENGRRRCPASSSCRREIMELTARPSGYGMAMVIELKPEQERILQEALRQGRFQSVEQALEEAIQSIVPGRNTQPALSPAERAAAFRLWAESHPHTTPVLSEEAIRRESIYSDRG